MWSQVKTEVSIWNWSIEWGVFFYKDNSGLFNDYQSYWAFLNWKIWNNKETFWELWLYSRLSRHDIKYFSGKEATYDSVSLWLRYSKELINNNDFKLNLWASLQWHLLNNTNETSNYAWLTDWSLWYWVALNWDYKVNPELNINGNFSYGWDMWINLRTENLDSIANYGKYSVWAWFDYDTLKWTEFWANARYENGLWYEEVWMDWYLKTGDFKIEAWYEKNTDTTYLELWEKIKAYILIEEKINEVLSVNANLYQENRYWNETKRVSVWVEHKF